MIIVSFKYPRTEEQLGLVSAVITQLKAQVLHGMAVSNQMETQFMREYLTGYLRKLV